MNRTSTLGRKLIYLSVLVAMLIPLYLLGQPAGGKGDLGGKLSVMRHEYNMAESDLGEISPASETMKLASLGLRGVAATLLWNKAHRYRVLHEWDRLKATLNNIALLQPHFDKVWEHQAHNLAYNVSTEFDDYRQRYEMVREGTEFLTRGVRQNRNAPRLIWYTGWFYGQKMGMSDEKRQFRRLFSDDEVLHESLLAENIAVDTPEARGPLGKPDNWLVGRLWLNHGYELVDSGVQIRRQTPLNFYETGPKWRFKHAEAIESEGILDEGAQNAWQMASDDWAVFGNRNMPTTSPFTIKLAQLDELIRRKEERLERFRKITGKIYEDAYQQNFDNMAPHSRELWETPESELSDEQKDLRQQVVDSLIPNLKAVANSSDPAVRLEAINLVGEFSDLDAKIRKTRGYRTQINYPYWETLAIAEQEERTVKARRLIFEAEEANDRAELDLAINLYEEAFEIWVEIFDDYPILTIDDTAQDLFESVRRYMIAIDSQDIPDDFPLKVFVEMMGQYGEVNAKLYAKFREESKASTEARRKELEEEEKKREEAAAKAEAEAKAKEKADAEAKEKADESPEADSDDSKGDDESPAEADTDDSAGDEA
ncbi:MAG: IRE (iron responsive element) [Rubripirellula sp.]